MGEPSNSLASTVLISNEQRSKEERLKSRGAVEQIPMNEPNHIETWNQDNCDYSSQAMNGIGFVQLLKSDWWEIYKGLLRRYRIPLELAEEALERILFWMPHSDSEDDSSSDPQHKWREVLFGLLSLHRLSMYCASQENEGTMGLENSYGMTIQTKERPSISATRIRIYLSILHCLMPTLLELLPTSRNSKKIPSARQQRQSRVRLRLEQIKFGLRLYLLASYWMQQQREQSREGESWLGTLWKNNTFNVGILQAGGMFDVVGQGSGLHSQEAERLGRRTEYMGRRTGFTIRLANGNDKILAPSISTSANARSTLTSELNGNASDFQERRQRKGRLIGIVIGELLHILRPLYWASAEAYSGTDKEASSSLTGLSQLSSSSLKMLKPWIETLLMDLVSLKLLWKNATKNSGNPWTYDEWKRRKGRLLLYLLRGPFWSKLTHPVLETGSSIWTKIPILGRLLDVFLWDWILYWKLPYIAEEG